MNGEDEERDHNNELLIGVAGAAALFGAAYWLFSGKSETSTTSPHSNSV